MIHDGILLERLAASLHVKPDDSQTFRRLATHCQHFTGQVIFSVPSESSFAANSAFSGNRSADLANEMSFPVCPSYKFPRQNRHRHKRPKSPPAIHP